MNFVPVITHAFAILIGWLLISFACIPDHRPAGNSAFTPRARPASFHRTVPRQTPSPRSLLSAQAETSMDPRRRDELKERIFRDWAKSDPAGMLAHLENRPWLTGLRPPTEDALNALARSHPANLLDHARRNGCNNALFALSANGDPRVALELYLDEPPNTIPSHAFRTLFKSGCALEPEFHCRLDQVTDPAARLAAFLGSAEILLNQKRDDTFFPWLSRHADTLPPEPVATLIAKQFVQDQVDLNRLSQLPDAIRSEALAPTLRRLASHSPPGLDSYQRASLTVFLQNGWLEGRADLANAVITASENHGPGWKHWALELPDNPQWDTLRRNAVQRWARADPTQWNTFTDLPSPALRDAAYAAALHTIDLQGSADRIPWLIDQISDPSSKNRAVETVTKRVKNERINPMTITTGSLGGP